MNTSPKRTAAIISALINKHNIDYCNQYGEPGYSTATGVILANWNNISKRVADYLEFVGYSLEWSDEWTIDSNYSKAYRTQADSYHWQSSIAYTSDGEILTPDDDDSEWIANATLTYEGQAIQAVPHRIGEESLHDMGFELVEGSLENGFFEGQTDNPQLIAIALFARGASGVVFRVSEQSQFYTKFQAYAHFPEETKND